MGEEAAGLLSDIFPDAVYAEDAMKLLGFVIALRDAGYWKPAEPTDPSMAHAQGNTGQGTPQMHQAPVIVPGGTPENPYNYDNRPKWS